MTQVSNEKTNAVWLYLGQEARNAEEAASFAAWCCRNHVGKVLVHLALDSQHREALSAQVNLLIEVCEAAGIEVHAMIGALVQRTADRKSLLFQDADCYCVDVHGISNWDEPVSGTAYMFDPGNPRVVGTISEDCAALALAFPGLAGIHLDFVRYYYFDSVLNVDTRSAGHWLGSVPKTGQPVRIETANGVRTTYFVQEAANAFNDPPIGDKLVLRHEYRFCFCDACVGGFLAQSGVELPAELGSGGVTAQIEGESGGERGAAAREQARGRIAERAAWLLREHAEAWAAYRAGLITALIGSIRGAVQQARPTAQVSATIWYNAPYGNELRGEPLQPGSVDDCFGQRWEDWVEQGLVDFLCPMDYWLSPDSFADIVRQQVAGAGNVPVYPGILNSQEYPLTAAQLNEYQALAAQTDASGVCLFHYGSWKAILQ